MTKMSHLRPEYGFLSDINLHCSNLKFDVREINRFNTSTLMYQQNLNIETFYASHFTSRSMEK